MLAIPTLKFSYGNLLFVRLHELGSANIEELLDADPAQLFKSGGSVENPKERARDCLRFARMRDLVVEDERRWMLTESGRTYAENVDLSNPWVVNDVQAGVLRDRLFRGGTELAEGVRTALQVVRELTAGFTNDDLGRALAEHVKSVQWQPDRTFESQGARYRELLVESGVIHRHWTASEGRAHLIGRSGRTPPVRSTIQSEADCCATCPVLQRVSYSFVQDQR
ncbi:hypothetical protein HZU38_11450 [Mycolicibacterium vanbaalenii]|uniref:hypothetical protein n=1 Tax=Mycolicibacterium vanbaalenii TaxID=110539 RepID=UPI001F1A6399|nr:hypothetical protein [Mycolicibacterium vanbaalenii]UJL30967.1 hypothetical protein HZU38_11450 [Mycolicibacterium vanbaalenii]WND57790.1 hypothetical protein QQA43_05065 [Mycolicibacterium vanbaalenii]